MDIIEDLSKPVENPIKEMSESITISAKSSFEDWQYIIDKPHYDDDDDWQDKYWF